MSLGGGPTVRCAVGYFSTVDSSMVGNYSNAGLDYSEQFMSFGINVMSQTYQLPKPMLHNLFLLRTINTHITMQSKLLTCGMLCLSICLAAAIPILSLSSEMRILSVNVLFGQFPDDYNSTNVPGVWRCDSELSCPRVEMGNLSIFMKK